MSLHLELDFQAPKENSREISAFVSKQVSVILRKHSKEYIKFKDLIKPEELKNFHAWLSHG